MDHEKRDAWQAVATDNSRMQNELNIEVNGLTQAAAFSDTQEENVNRHLNTCNQVLAKAKDFPPSMQNFLR